jgi:hypothetical protein
VSPAISKHFKINVIVKKVPRLLKKVRLKTDLFNKAASSKKDNSEHPGGARNEEKNAQAHCEDNISQIRREDGGSSQ